VLPTAAIPIVPVLNLPGITANQIIFDLQSLAYIFMGIIKTWNDPALVALNPGIQMPAANITRYTLRCCFAGLSYHCVVVICYIIVLYVWIYPH
jgi:hypothetical protein